MQKTGKQKKTKSPNKKKTQLESKKKFEENKVVRKLCKFKASDLDRITSSLHSLLTMKEVGSKRSHSMTGRDFIQNRLAVINSLRERSLQLGPEDLAEYRRLRSHLVREVFGTQEPTIKLRSDPTTDGYTTGIADVDVANAQFQGLHDQGSWAAIFDEYRMIKGHFYWMSYIDALSSNIRGLACGVIDYDDSTAITVLGNLTAYDTYKCFAPATSINEVHSWPWHSQGIPDLEWTSTTVNSSPCYFKWNCFGNTATISTAYSIWFEAEVEFRQVEV